MDSILVTNKRIFKLCSRKFEYCIKYYKSGFTNCIYIFFKIIIQFHLQLNQNYIDVLIFFYYLIYTCLICFRGNIKLFYNIRIRQKHGTSLMGTWTFDFEERFDEGKASCPQPFVLWEYNGQSLWFQDAIWDSLRVRDQIFVKMFCTYSK